MKLETKAVLMGAGAGTLGVALFLAQPSRAQDPAPAPDPTQARDDTWITISGTVVSTSPDSFRLDYGGGVITVEMDDYDFYQEGHAILDNDQVEVFGVIDDDLFEKRTIEASSVYVENLGTRFYASAADEEDFGGWSTTARIDTGQVTVTGTVTSIQGREFTIDTGTREVRVDTAAMLYNPLDDSGYLQIDEGDLVKVSGDSDRALFDKREINADWIIKRST